MAAGNGAQQSGGLRRLGGLEVDVSVEIARRRGRLSDVLALHPGSLLPLDRPSDALAAVWVDDRLVAHGQLVTVGERYGVRIISLVEPLPVIEPEAPAKPAATKALPRADWVDVDSGKLPRRPVSSRANRQR